MGYTHYWTQPRDLTPDEMDSIATVAKAIIAAAEGTTTHTAGGWYEEVPVTICGGDGYGPPTITHEEILLNGDGQRGIEHETFAIHPKREPAYPGGPMGWACCKTARKPYDVVVTAILAYLAAYHDFDVASDGDTDEWEAGAALANEAVGKPVPNPMIVEVMGG